MTMSLNVDLFWSFRSPYSYLALRKTRQLMETYDVSVSVRPVYPLAIRDPDFFKRINPLLPHYVSLDSRRVAERDGIPFRFPRPDPVSQDMRSLEVAETQPHIRRLTRLGAAAQEAGRAFQFVDEVSQVIWDGTVDGWDQGDHLAQAAKRAGIDLVALETAISDNPDPFDELIKTNESDLAAAGHWGVPTFVFKGEPFFGQDRIDLLLWRLEQHGLSRRHSADAAFERSR
jgi:2-hydroxychromene-2-carboxylate isomerase